jgi:hypothetical protein
MLEISRWKGEKCNKINIWKTDRFKKCYNKLNKRKYTNSPNKLNILSI